MTTEIHPSLLAQLTEMQTTLYRISTMLDGTQEVREFYTVEEVAEKTGKRPYTVREWCRNGRINATKRIERRGGAELWKISASEIVRIKDEGLLPLDRHRNAA